MSKQQQQNCDNVNILEAYGNDTRRVPTWITEEYFVDIVKQQVPDFEKITKFSAFPALRAGENYATLMVRVSIVVQLKAAPSDTISFMLKVGHDFVQIQEINKIFNTFAHENSIYFDVIPELEQMYKDVGRDISLAPKAFKFLTNPDCDTVLLEDLCPHGYKNANRLEGLDMAHTKCVLKKLAQLHAVSAHRFAIKGLYVNALKYGLYGDKTKTQQIMPSIIKGFKEGFLNNINYYKDGAKYKESVLGYFEDLDRRCYEIISYNADEFNVLNHADAWTNNVLFRYAENGEIIDTLFVDFQISSIGSPAADLMYFLVSSPKLELKIAHFDYLIRYYYDELVAHLKLLRYPKPLITLRQLYVHLLKYGMTGPLAMFMTLGVVLLDPNEDAQLENYLSDDEQGVNFKNLMFTNKRYQTQINELLPWMCNRGFLSI